MKKLLHIICLLLLFLNGTFALLAGWSMMADPTGGTLGMSTAMLVNAPFHDYLIPGVVLFGFNGILSFYTGLMVWIKDRLHPQYLIFQGVVLIVWIVVQIIMIQTFDPLQVVCSITGFIFISSGIYLRAQAHTRHMAG